jgi:hypothetical protein
MAKFQVRYWVKGVARKKEVEVDGYAVEKNGLFVEFFRRTETGDGITTPLYTDKVMLSLPRKLIESIERVGD